MIFVTLSPRRVRIMQYALFGVFVFHFSAVLHAEDLLVLALRLCPSFAEQHLLSHPQLLGATSTLVVLPFFVWSDKRWKWIDRIGSPLRQWFFLFLACFLLGVLTPSDEQTTLERQTARLHALGLNRQALEVGTSYPFTTVRLQALRLQALGNDEQIGQGMFAFPMHYFRKEDRTAAYLQLSLPVTQGGLNYLITQKKVVRESPLISALLDGDLTGFAKHLPRRYLNSERSKIPLYFQQALLLYMRLNTHPVINYYDDATDANYRDFVKQQQELRLQYPPARRERFSIAEKNKMNYFFGNTYWYYFFYEVGAKSRD